MRKNPLKIAYGNGIFACWPTEPLLPIFIFHRKLPEQADSFSNKQLLIQVEHPLQNNRYNQVIYRTADNADRHCHKKQAVEQVISVFLVSAGTKNQAAAGWERADRTALCTKNRAGKECCRI